MKWVLVAVLLSGSFACSKPDDQKTESIKAADATAQRKELSPAARAQLDSGNAAFKANDFAKARTHYQRVTDIDKDAAVGWFGIYMAEQARGNAAAADSALKRVQSEAPGASLVHPKAQ